MASPLPRDPTGREHARHFDARADAEVWFADVAPVATRTGMGARRRFRDQAPWWQSVQVQRESTAVQVESYLRSYLSASHCCMVSVMSCIMRKWQLPRDRIVS